MAQFLQTARACVALAVVLTCMVVIYVFRLDDSDDEEWYGE